MISPTAPTILDCAGWDMLEGSLLRNRDQILLNNLSRQIHLMPTGVCAIFPVDLGLG